ncbi:MAG TPA: hypothetical protein VIK18_09475 [Pirellulales bacterium]
MKITSAMVDEVERMLAQGLVSQRKIAKLVGISRGTVNSIALGRRPRISAPADAFEPQRGPLVRCPGCGGRVFLPCLLCHIRQLKAKEPGLPDCSHRGRLHPRSNLHGGDARTCRQPGTGQGIDHHPGDRADPPPASPSRLLAASPSVLAPAPEVSSFTPAAAHASDVGYAPAGANSTLPELAGDR